jgi:hypothetical protein
MTRYLGFICAQSLADSGHSAYLYLHQQTLEGDAMSDKPEHNKLDSDCTLPPDHPLPADQLGRYSPERDFYAEKEIAEYVEGQLRGEETVQNVERVKTEYVMGTPSSRRGPRSVSLRNLGRQHRQRPLVGHHRPNQPLFPEALSKPRLYALVSHWADDSGDEPVRQRRRRRSDPV